MDMRFRGMLLVLFGVTAAVRPSWGDLPPQTVSLGSAQVGFRAHFGEHRVAGMDVCAAEMLDFSVRTNDTTLSVTWRGHPVLGDGFSVTAEFVPADAGWTYSLSVGCDVKAMRLESVDFPVVTVPHTPKAGIVYPRAMGMGMLRRPDWKKHPEEVPLADEPAKNFQFVALVDEDTGGWYVDARDERHFHKRVFARKGDWYGKTATLGFRWLVPEDGATSVRLPWTGLVTPYSGGWFQAASIYRTWARTTAVCRHARARNPGKLRDIALWAWNRGSIENVIPPLEKFGKDAGVPVALDWYWWHNIPYDTSYPNFWPPREGEAAFRAAVRRLKKAGIHSMVYVNGYSWDQDDPSWADGGEDCVTMDHDVSYQGVAYNCYNGHRLARMCGEAPQFQEKVRQLVKTLASTGLDGVYLDQISCAGNRPCWNPAHRHVKGGGSYSVEGYRAYVEAVRAENPGLLLSSEEPTEDFMDVFDSFISVVGPSYERCGLGVRPEFEALPVWNAIYHGDVVCFGNYTLLDGIPPYDEKWPAEGRWKSADEKDWMSLYPDQFAIEFCRGVAWGQQPSVHNFLLKFATEARYAADYQLMVETARFYYAHRDFLFDGEMRDLGKMTCPRQDKAFMLRATYAKSGVYREEREQALPVLFHNVWKAPDGRVCLILVNWSRTDAAFAFASADGTAQGTVPARSWAAFPLESADDLRFEPIGDDLELSDAPAVSPTPINLHRITTSCLPPKADVSKSAFQTRGRRSGGIA